MAVKYYCPKCNKRFVEWGAEKLGFKCPDCKGEALVQVGSGQDKPVKRPSLKRVGRRIPVEPVAEPSVEEGEAAEEGLEFELEVEEEKKPLILSEEEARYTPEPELAIGGAEPAAEPADIEMPEDLTLTEAGPALPEEPLGEADELNEEEWTDKD